MADRRRSPLRILAPMALVGFAVAFLFVLTSSDVTGGDEGSAREGRDRGERAVAGGERRRGPTARQRRERQLPSDFYTVRANDTLGLIAEKNGVPVDRLQLLNPELDPQQLSPGQKIKLRE